MHALLPTSVVDELKASRARGVSPRRRPHLHVQPACPQSVGSVGLRRLIFGQNIDFGGQLSRDFAHFEGIKILEIVKLNRRSATLMHVTDDVTDDVTDVTVGVRH